jgi:hypothetical protein
LLGQQIDVNFVVAILEEDDLAPVATLRDMVRKPRNHDPCKTRHAKNRSMESGSRSHQCPVILPLDADGLLVPAHAGTDFQ